MTLPRQEVIQGLQDELGRFEELVRSLSADELQQPSRCDGWTVGDIAGHVIGGMADITAGRFDGLGTPEVTQRQVDERKGRSAAELGDELQQVTKVSGDLLLAFDTDEAWASPAPGDLGFPLGEGVEALWYDAFLHGEDMRAAVGRPLTATSGLRVAVSHVADVLSRQDYPPATIALDGQDEFAVSGGGGTRIAGDPYEFVLVATGRSDPAAFGLDETINIYRA